MEKDGVEGYSTHTALRANARAISESTDVQSVLCAQDDRLSSTGASWLGVCTQRGSVGDAKAFHIFRTLYCDYCEETCDMAEEKFGSTRL